jgi:hypothetical protein
MEDRELDAMQAILTTLQPLDAEERMRVLRWAWERLGDGGVGGTAGARPEPSASEGPQFADAAEVVEAAGANNGPERALCVAYYLQQVSGQPSFGGQEINSILKHLGHPLANVTTTLGSLRAQRPALVMQVSKSGRSRQARKTYRLTEAGLERIRQMLGRAG